MPQLIIRHDDETREIRYDVKEWEEPQGALYREVHLCPVEIDRIKNAKSEEIQQILRRYI